MVMVIVVTEILVTVCHLWLHKNPQHFRGWTCICLQAERENGTAHSDISIRQIYPPSRY